MPDKWCWLKMKGTLDVQEALETLFAMGNIAYETKRILAKGLRSKDSPLPSPDQDYLSLALEHLETVREGFVLSLRAASVADWEELRYLVRRILFDWTWLEELGLALAPSTEVQRVGSQLLAFAHAYVSLGVLPRLPPTEVTFPQGRPTYADIPVPRTPGEVLTRIEEMERVVWEAEVKPVGELEPEPLRRTYGFFEAGAWLVARHLPLFLGRARPSASSRDWEKDQR